MGPAEIINKKELAKCKVLIVDDDSITLALLQQLLSSCFDVYMAGSGHECLDFVDRIVPDAILLDLHMPDMTGFEVMEELMKRPRLKYTEVIFLTADNDQQTEVNCFKAGGFDFISKPFATEVVIQRLTRLLELKRLHRNLEEEITVQTAKAEELCREIECDALTGLLLRGEGEYAIEQAMKLMPGCLAFFDIDNLKKVNDTFGHSFGDRVLKLFGWVLKEFGSDMICCRYGGDEFLVFMQNVSARVARNRVNKIINRFTEAKDGECELRYATLSAGLCMTEAFDEFDEAMNRADKALYYVKQNGKDTYFFYRKKDDENNRYADVDLSQLVKSLQNTGTYSGAMDVEYREFARLYEYVRNLYNRHRKGYHLVMITLDGKDGVSNTDTEKAMKVMEEVIDKTIRNVDICTRLSNIQYLLILLEASDENVNMIMSRVIDSFYDSCGNDGFKAIYEIAVPEDNPVAEGAAL